MEINAQEIIDKLTNDYAKLYSKNVVMEFQIEALQEQNQTLAAERDGYKEELRSRDETFEGEVVGG